MYIRYIIPSEILTKESFWKCCQLWNQERDKLPLTREQIFNYFESLDPIKFIGLFTSNHELVGFVSFLPTQKYGIGERYLYINNIYVLPEYRHTYGAGKLFKEIKRLAQIHECKYIIYNDDIGISVLQNHPEKFIPVGTIYKQEVT